MGLNILCVIRKRWSYPVNRKEPQNQIPNRGDLARVVGRSGRATKRRGSFVFGSRWWWGRRISLRRVGEGLGSVRTWAFVWFGDTLPWHADLYSANKLPVDCWLATPNRLLVLALIGGPCVVSLFLVLVLYTYLCYIFLLAAISIEAKKDRKNLLY